MHPAGVHDEVQRLIAAGLRDGQIARELGLARTTVRDMREPRRVERPACPRCWLPAKPMRFTAGEYAELLGLYLGDGYVVRAGRTHRLRICFDAAHPQLIADAERLLLSCFPENNVSRVRGRGGTMVVLSVYSTHLPCLFPQHGSGKKHDRALSIEPWQLELIDAAPWSFLRGLVHSDGCFFINRTGRYAYLSVDFCNLSAEIRALFCRACERVGVAARPTGDRVRVYRRESVALLAAFVGAKW